MSETDLQLLARYTRNHTEDAFAELVRRHVDLVHSAALRQVRSMQLAEEVAQSVFTDLARNSGRLRPDTILTAWLYEVTRRTAIDVVRREARRQLREQIATEMNAMNATTADWTQIEPLLDEAMAALDETDRAAVLLRYFENKSLREVGAALCTSDDAAQKRVSRAVERLREYFTKRGVAVGAGGLVLVISANAVQAAPVGLALTISTAAAFAGTAVVTTATGTAIKAIAMTTLQKTLISAAIMAAAGAAIYEARQASTLRSENHALEQQQAKQTQQLIRAGEEATRQLAALRDENDRLRQNSGELLRLRGEAARLRSESQELSQLRKRDSTQEKDPLESALRLWVARVNKLKQRLEEMPGKKIAELQFLSADDWLEVGQGYFEDDRGSNIRRLLAELRRRAKLQFANLAGQALNEYILANNGELPNEISQLKPYFSSAVSDSMVERYQLLHTGKLAALPMTEGIITEKATVDDREDTLFTIGAYGWRWKGTGLLTTGTSEGSWDTSRIKAFMKQ